MFHSRIEIYVIYAIVIVFIIMNITISTILMAIFSLSLSHLAELGLTADWQSSSLPDEIWARLEILKACCRSRCSIFRFV